MAPYFYFGTRWIGSTRWYSLDAGDTIFRGLIPVQPRCIRGRSYRCMFLFAPSARFSFVHTGWPLERCLSGMSGRLCSPSSTAFGVNPPTVERFPQVLLLNARLLEEKVLTDAVLPVEYVSSVEQSFFFKHGWTFLNGSQPHQYLSFRWRTRSSGQLWILTSRSAKVGGLPWVQRFLPREWS